MPKRWLTRHGRLVIAYMLIFSTSVALLGAMAYFSATDYIEAQLTRELTLSAQQLLVDYRQEGLEELRHDIGERIDLDHYDRLLYSLRAPDGTVQFDPLVKFPEVGLSVVDGQKPLLVYVTNLDDGYQFAVATSLDDILSFQKALRNTFVFAIIATLLLGAGGGSLLSRRYMARVEEIRNVAEGFGEGNLKLRVPVRGNEDDFDVIAESINKMLIRIEALLAEVRRVSTNIAHDLRTPIGRVRQKIERLSSQPDLQAESRALAAESIELVDGTLQTFSALLRIAEIGSGVRKSGFVRFDLSEMTLQICTTYAAVAEDSGYDLRHEIESGLVMLGDRSLMLQLISNLIENCFQHTPEGSKIQVSLKSVGSKLSLKVEDNGPGLRGHSVESLLEPFYKGDESRSREGAGLGLSVVDAIAKLHDLKLSIEEARPGFKVHVEMNPA